MFVCAGKSEQFDFAKPIGIGLMDVAIKLTQICIEQKPEYLHFVGSAGSYGRYQIFDIVESSSACNIENSLFNARAYSPIENSVSCETMHGEIIVNSSNYITTDSSLSKAYEARKIYLENMEFYAVAKVAKAFDIPMQGTFIITNYCDSNAHEDFLKYHQEAMSKLTTYIKEKK